MLLTLVLLAALSGFGVKAARPGAANGHQPLRRVAMAVSGADSLDVALYARILKSADQRVLDTALIASGLESRDAEMRRVAARTLSQVALRHRRRAIPLLRNLTRDADSAVASSAIFGLGLVRDTASVALLASIARASGHAAPSAAWALGEIGASAADTIVAILGDTVAAGRASHATLRELLFATSRIRPLRIAAVTPYLASRDAELRWAAAYAVARARARSGVRALLEAPNPDAAFRAELARVLSTQTVGDSLRTQAIQRLRSLVSDASPYVRINALHSIASFGTSERETILRALRDRDANVRVAAAESAAPAFDTVASAWRDAWAIDTAYKVRRSLLEGAIASGVSLPADSAWRASRDWRMRGVAVAAWSHSRDTARARTIAIAATTDTDARVRGAAYQVLIASDTGRVDSAVQRVIAAGRADPDSIVRSAIPGTRVRSLDTAAVERPLEWYEDAVRRVVLPSLRGHPPRAVMRTVRGRIVITFDGVLAPLTVLNFATLADRHAYDSLRFHRVVPGFVAQDGDPRGDGEGGPGYAIRDELTLLPYSRGAVGMALSGPDTGGSQYFLTLTPQPHLTGHYTVFGSVTSGFRAMDALVEGDAIRSIRIRW